MYKVENCNYYFVLVVEPFSYLVLFFCVVLRQLLQIKLMLYSIVIWIIKLIK